MMLQMSHKSTWLVESIYASVVMGALAVGNTTCLGQDGPAREADEATARSAASRTAREHLSLLTPQQRANTRIEIEPLRAADADRLVEIESTCALWNEGRHDAALAALSDLEARLPIAIGITRLDPPASEGGIAGFGDTTISATDAVGAIALDVHKATGNLYCVVQTADGWDLHRSVNNGATWTNPYSWAGVGGLNDVDAAIVGDLVYIGYVHAGTNNELRVRRNSATTGASDGAYAFVTAYDAAPSAIEEVAAVGNTEESNNNIFFATLDADDSVRYHWDAANDGETWTETDTGFTNAESGLDATWNPGNEEWFLFLSYIGNDGTIKVARRASLAGWDSITVEPAYDGVATHTAISAWEDTIIVGHRDAGTDGYGLRYRVSYDGGDSWLVGDIYESGAGVDNVVSFDVTARGGFGTAAVYVLEEGAVDSVFFRKRDGYSITNWDAAVQINQFEPFASTTIDAEINWIATIDGSPNNHRFGIVYDTPDPVFDRRQQCDGDVNDSGEVDVDDLLAVITAWGACVSCPPSCNADITPFGGDCNVDVDDMLEVISFWGPCS